MTATGLAERVYREERRAILATLIRVCGGDFELAEDVVQEAFEVALARWPEDGPPPNPAAWITTTARRKAIDRLRRRQNLASKEDGIRQYQAGDKTSEDDDMSLAPVRDDELRLIFTCLFFHPFTI